MTGSPLHPGLAQGRWFEMTLPDQLGNIGSEYGRALSWKNKGNSVYFQKAFDRMLELLDLTINDPRWRNHRLRELTRLREEACRLQEGPETGGHQMNLTKYFLQYATLARRQNCPTDQDQ
jgi:hypothetical protein